MLSNLLAILKRSGIECDPRQDSGGPTGRRGVRGDANPGVALRARLVTKLETIPCISELAAVSVKLLEWGSRGIGSPAGGRLPASLWSK